MRKLAGRGAAGCMIHAKSRAWIWLVASLILIFVQACQRAAGTDILPTQGEYNTIVNPTSGEVNLTPVIAKSQTGTSPLFTQTYTSEPSVPEPVLTSTPEATATTSPAIVFAVIGDFGSGNQDEADVANLILSWQPEFIITVGDNNYPSGTAKHMEEAVGQFFHSFIFPYQGSSGAGAEVNRFFPCLGNHDLMTENGKPYFDYFTLPGNERYYDFTWGSLHFFALNSSDSEPDGVGASSIQAKWLKAGLASSTSDWNIVYMHYPPYSSGTHGSTDWTRWPYGEWGADAVLAGHDHTYERLTEDGLTYFVNGLGGNGRYDFAHILEGSQVRYNGDYGAMRVEATNKNIQFEFINREDEVVDSYDMGK